MKLKDLLNVIPKHQNCRFDFTDSEIIGTKEIIKDKHKKYCVTTIRSSPLRPILIIELDGTYETQ